MWFCLVKDFNILIFFPAAIWKKQKKNNQPKSVFLKVGKNRYLVIGPAPLGSR